MAAVDSDYRSSPYFEIKFNVCDCEEVAAVSTVNAGPIPAPLEDGEKRDIYFDVSAATGPDYSVTPAGDWLPVSGDEALRQSLLRRFITNPGEWLTKPDYGAGGRAFLKAKGTKSERDAFAQRLRAQALKDDRVEKVGEVAVERFADGGTKFRVQIEPKAKPKRAQPITVTFEGR